MYVRVPQRPIYCMQFFGCDAVHIRTCTCICTAACASDWTQPLQSNLTYLYIAVLSIVSPMCPGRGKTFCLSQSLPLQNLHTLLHSLSGTAFRSFRLFSHLFCRILVRICDVSTARPLALVYVHRSLAASPQRPSLQSPLSARPFP
ncbi:hypothetical protein HDV62DRAFT_310603 [Trichoderma sp. SZMC 28011]